MFERQAFHIGIIPTKKAGGEERITQLKFYCHDELQNKSLCWLGERENIVSKCLLQTPSTKDDSSSLVRIPERVSPVANLLQEGN